MNGLTGEHLKIARLIYGYRTQKALAKKMGITVGTVHRYETLQAVPAKVIGEYEHRAHFDLYAVTRFVMQMRVRKQNDET